MTDVTPQSGGLPARRPAMDEDKAGKVRRSLAQISKQYLAPFRALEAVRSQQEEGRRSLRSDPSFLGPCIHRPAHPTSEEERERSLRHFDAALQYQPDRLSLATIRNDLATAIMGKAAPTANRLIVGLMVGSFPNVRPYSPETYLEALVEALDQTGLPPASVAKACNEITRTRSFAPSVAEVIEMAERVQAEAKITIRAIGQYGETLDWAADVRAWLKGVPILADDRSNYDRPPSPPASLAFSSSTVEWR